MRDLSFSALVALVACGAAPTSSTPPCPPLLERAQASAAPAPPGASRIAAPEDTPASPIATAAVALASGRTAAQTQSLASATTTCVIDDAEDGDNRIALHPDRDGYWFTFADVLGTTLMPTPGRTVSMFPGGHGGSRYAARMSGRLANKELAFAGMGLNFRDRKGIYDASAYTGLSFYAMVGAGSTRKVRVKVPDVSTDPDGKVCSECFNDFGADLELTTVWTKYSLPFSALTQLAGWGVPRPRAVDAKIYGVQWHVVDRGAAYDVWVDDIEFTGCP